MNDNETNSSEDESVGDVDGLADERPPRWTSGQILKGCNESVIIHEGEVYRLRLTRNNKLILYK